VGTLVPGIHGVERRVALVDGEDRAFDPLSEVGVGHHHRDLDDAVGVGVQAGHFQVDPDQVLIAAGEQGVA
jgi:hypothetical protein